MSVGVYFRLKTMRSEPIVRVVPMSYGMAREAGATLGFDDDMLCFELATALS
jgi:hypothetical protein